MPYSIWYAFRACPHGRGAPDNLPQEVPPQAELTGLPTNVGYSDEVTGSTCASIPASLMISRGRRIHCVGRRHPSIRYRVKGLSGPCLLKYSLDKIATFPAGSPIFRRGW